MDNTSILRQSAAARPELWSTWVRSPLAKPATERWVIYGESGVGKTRLASTFPNPLFIDMDGGMDSIDPDLVIGRVPASAANKVSSLKELRQAWTDLSEKTHPFQTVVLDSVNELMEICLLNTVTTYTGKGYGRQYDDIPNQGDYGKGFNDFFRVIDAFFLLPLHVVLIGTPAPKGTEMERIKLGLTGKQTAGTVFRKASEVGFMRTMTVEDKLVRRLYLESDHFVVKNRYNLPAKVDDPTYSTIWGARS